ncbi:YciI-like protein [Gramella sp. AN32]|uniref:YciI-like protein n=1 Tax=Christiangramia antarctica TaxID=2058158 RepID=A0ABW5X6Y7_9FLAO|nr:YciI-like protein [Gramella sp. AN32]MCM4157687.1 hypothetical protein [Gramella sp. AN32]
MLPYYILFYETVNDYLEKRGQYREEHLKLANTARKNGNLIMAGAFANPADGAALIFKAENAEIPKEFAKNDPYVKNGLVKNWELRDWTVVIGNENPEAEPSGNFIN